MAAGLAAVQTFLNPNEKSAAHLNAGNSYDALNGKVRIFWTVECWEAHPDRVLTEKLKNFASEKERLNWACPQIHSWAYRRAGVGLNWVWSLIYLVADSPKTKEASFTVYSPVLAMPKLGPRPP